MPTYFYFRKYFKFEILETRLSGFTYFNSPLMSSTSILIILNVAEKYGINASSKQNMAYLASIKCFFKRIKRFLNML